MVYPVNDLFPHSYETEESVKLSSDNTVDISKNMVFYYS